MDKSTTIQELKTKVKKFCDERDWDQFHPPKDLVVGIVTEASELLAHFRFKSESEQTEIFNNSKKRQDVEDKTADVFYFLLRFAQMYNIDLSEALKNKLKKNESRYPKDKAKGSNKKYNEL